MIGDMTLFNGAITGLKVAADLAVAFGNLKTMAEVQAKAIELQQVILSAQSSALAAQGEQFTLVQRIRDLEKEVADAKAWEEQRKRYALVAPWKGAVLYALKRECRGSEPAHWICTQCYEDGAKSILLDVNEAPARGPRRLVLACHRCKTQIETGHAGGSVERKYAEDIA